MSPRITSLLLPVATMACVLGGSLSAQVPDGYYVASSYRRSGWSGPGGLFFGHPVHAGPATPVTGLPPEVTGACPSNQLTGANFVVRRPSDGTLVTNGYCLPNPLQPQQLFVLSLQGSAVVQTTPITIGTITRTYASWGFGQGVPQAVMLPDERLAIAWDGGGLPGQPLANTLLGIVDLDRGTVSAVPVNPLPPVPAGSSINALAVDSQRGVAYLGMDWGTSWIYSVPFPNGGAPTLVCSIPGGIGGLVVDRDGHLWASGFGLFHIDMSRTPPQHTRIQTQPTLGAINAIAMESATGCLLAVGSASTSVPYEVYRLSSNGAAMRAATRIGSAPTGGWGSLSGIDLNPDPETYGTATPGNKSYAWQIAPNPGGLPVAGNAFSLAVNADPGPMPPGLWFISPSKAPARIPPLEIDLQGAFFLPIPSSGRIDLGTIPPHLSETTVYFQSFFLDSGAPLGIAATEGLELTLL